MNAARRNAAGRVSPAAVLVALIAAGILGWAVVWSTGQTAGELPARYAYALRIKNEGKLEEARTAVREMRLGWAGDDPAKNAKLDPLDAEIDRIEELVAEGRERIREEATRRTRLEQFEELDALRKERPSEAEGVAARILLSELAELRLGVPSVSPPAVERATPEPVASGESDERVPEPEANRALEDQLAAVAARRDAREWNEAFELLRFARESAGPEDAQRFEEAAALLRRALRADLDETLRRVRESAAGGTLEDIDAALSMIDDAQERFPTGHGFDSLVAEEEDLRRLRERVAGGPVVPSVAESTGGATPARGDLADVLELERAGDFDAAADLVAGLAERARASDADTAAQLDARRIELELLAEFVAALEARVADGGAVELRSQSHGRIELVTGADGDLIARGEGGDGDIDWSSLDPAAVEELAGRARFSPRALAGAGALAYRLGDVVRAEAMLGEAVDREPELQATLDPVIARGRGQVVGAESYRFQDGRFLTAREVRLAERAEVLAREVRKLIDRPAPARESGIEEIASRGPDEVEALMVALHDEARRLIAELEKDSFRKQWERVAAARRALDDARAQALQLIFDQEKYFYPFKPPAVSAARQSEYHQVQREVDARVGRVLEMWDSGEKGKPVPDRLRERLGDVEWLLGTLESFAEPLRGIEGSIDWVRALPPEGRALDVQSFCWDANERRTRELWSRIDAFNEKKLEGLEPGEVALVRIINSYRTMMGRVPMALHPKLCEAARGHADEMTDLGYFAHMSPTEGRRTPFDRMRAVGYHHGAAENIANHPGAESAHIGWLHSSGHHRSLLAASHTEFGAGNSGRHWVVKFGAGQEYLTDPDWSAD